MHKDKNANIMFVLFLMVILLISCGDNKEPNSITSETTEFFLNPTQGEPDISPFASIDFPYSGGVIVEWGEQVTFESGETLEGDNAKWPIPEGKYVGFAVKYIYYFAGTAKSRYNYDNNKSDSDFFQFENQLIGLLDQETREYVLQNYDDVVVIKAEYADMIETGRTDFTFMYAVKVFPSSDIEGKEYSTIVRSTQFCKGDRFGEPILFPLVDGKLVMDERMYDTYEDEFGAVRYFNNIVYWAEKINGYLIALDKDEILFGDGITIEEMDAYFDLVCKTSTFRPLETAYDVGITDITPP